MATSLDLNAYYLDWSVAVISYKHDSASVDQLQQQMTVVLKNYDIMKCKTDQIINTYIPNLIISLDGAKGWADCLHPAAALGVAFIPAATGLTLASSCMAIGIYFADLCVQNTSRESQQQFKAQCQSAWLAYNVFLESFDKLCDMLSETDSEYSAGLQGDLTKYFIQSKSYSSSSNLSYNVELIDCVTSFLAKESEELGLEKVVLATIKKAETFVGRISTIAPVVGMVCSGYMLLNTISHFFESCAASRDIDVYMLKLDNFQENLLHILERMRFSIQMLKSEVARIEDKQKIFQLEQQLESQKRSFIIKMKMQKQSFDCSLKTQEEQFKRQMKTFKKQFKNQLKMQRDQHEEQRHHQLEIQKTMHEQQNFRLRCVLKNQEALVQQLLQQTKE